MQSMQYWAVTGIIHTTDTGTMPRGEVLEALALCGGTPTPVQEDGSQLWEFPALTHNVWVAAGGAGDCVPVMWDRKPTASTTWPSQAALEELEEAFGGNVPLAIGVYL